METQLEKRMREIAREEINKAFEELGKRVEAAADTTAPDEQDDAGELVKCVAELPNDGKLKIFI